VVNRVVGGLKSDILGQIHSNGAVYLINPKGIFIGSSALIETAGFIASTHDLLSSDLSENLRFAGESNALVVNEGVIRCGDCDVFLIGQSVDERGTIQAGKVGLLSGSEVLIRAGSEAPLVVRADDSIGEKMFRQNP